METENEALYNKFRPSTFEEVVGQDNVCSVIQEDLKDNNLHHSLILYGQVGTGKTTVARLIAKTLNPARCGTIEKDSAIDGKIDNIRDLQIDTMHLPVEGLYKTYIFDEAQKMTSQSFAALLKTIEEPPSHIKFIFVTTDLEAIPDNIKSRSQIFKFKKLPNKEIRERIKLIIKEEKFKLTDELVDVAVESGRGSLRNSIVALETIVSSIKAGMTSLDISTSLGILGSKKLFEFLKFYLEKNFIQMFNLTKIFKDENTDLSQVIYDLEQYIMDCRLSLASTVLSENMEMNVNYFLDYIKEQGAVKKGEEQRDFFKKVGKKLDNFYDQVVELEFGIKKTKNKDALLSRFVVKLGTTWND